MRFFFVCKKFRKKFESFLLEKSREKMLKNSSDYFLAHSVQKRS